MDRLERLLAQLVAAQGTDEGKARPPPFCFALQAQLKAKANRLEQSRTNPAAVRAR